MFTKSENIKLEYCAQIVKIGELLPIEGSDFLVKTNIGGAYQVVVGKNDVKTGDIMVYCKLETAINKDFLSVNNQFELGERHLNKNYEKVQKLIDEGKEDEAKKMVGYFNKHGRVRIVKLRGCASEGCLFTIDSLAKWNPNVLKYNFENCFKPNEDGVVVPFEFDTIDGVLFVEAYVPPLPQTRNSDGLTRNERKRGKKIVKLDRMVEGQFAFHYDTNQLNDNVWRFNPDTVVNISVKEHGCVDGDSIVNTLEYGDLKIRDIVEQRIPCKVKAYDIEKQEIVYVSIDDYYLLRNDGEWYEIELENGETLLITGNNPVWMPELNCYRRTDELKVGDVLLID